MAEKKKKNSRYYVVSNAKEVFDNYYHANKHKYETLSDFYEEIGEYCGVSPSTIGQMRLNGLAPSLIAGVKIGEFLDVKPTDIWKVVELDNNEERPRCIVEGCNRVGTTKGLCMRHVYLLKEKEFEESVASDIVSEEADVNIVEGKVKYYFLKKYERDSRNRMLAIKKHGLNCYVCDFNFCKVYGKLGEDFIEVHHIVPLSSRNEEVVVNHETDLVPLCANCHRMIHRSKEKVMSVEELKQIIKK